MAVNDINSKWPYWLGLVVFVAGALWLTWDYIAPFFSESGTAPEVVIEETPTERAPRYPLEQSPADLAAESAEEIAPLPPVDASDSYARAQLIEVFGTGIDTMLVSDDIIYKLAATADNLTTAKPSRKTWPVDITLESFAVVPAGEDMPDMYYPDPDNYRRYDFLVNLAASADPATMAAAYRQMYPLLQETYVALGYPDGYFNDRLVEVIDQLLGTPEPAEPVVLVQPHVLYQYADPELEALSGGQKLLLRMGNANAEKVKQILRAFRNLIVQPGDSAEASTSGAAIESEKLDSN